MEQEVLEQIAERWDRMTSVSTHLAELSLADMQTLLRDTYQALTAYHKDTLIPKQISKILLNIEEYLYFADMMEENETWLGFYCARDVAVLTKAMKEGFFTGAYTCAFPRLRVCDEWEIDLVGDYLPLFVERE